MLHLIFLYQNVFYSAHQDNYGTFFPSHSVWKLPSCFFSFSLLKSTKSFVMIVFDSCLLFHFHLLLEISIFPLMNSFGSFLNNLHATYLSTHKSFLYSTTSYISKILVCLCHSTVPQNYFLFLYCLQSVQTA